MSKKARYFIDRKASRIAGFEDDPDEKQAIVRVTDLESLTTKSSLCAKYGKEHPLGTSWTEISRDQFSEIVSRLELERKKRREASYTKVPGAQSAARMGYPQETSYTSSFGSGFWIDTSATDRGTASCDSSSTAQLQPIESVKASPAHDAISDMKDRIHEVQCAAYKAQIKNRSEIIDRLREENGHIREMIETVRTEYLDTKNLLEIAEEKIRKLTEKKDEGCKLRSA